MTRIGLFALFFATSAACATSDTQGPAVTGSGGGKADGQVASITFADDWSETVAGTLVAGSPIEIRYDLDRLPDCHASNGWGATGYASFDGEAPVTFDVSSAATLDVPAGATHVDLWFSSSNGYGCIAYDSNENANYGFDLAPIAEGATLAFHADFTEEQTGALVAGEQAVVHYDPERLATCAASSGGMAKWSVTMHYTVDGGAVKTLLVTHADGAELVANDATLTVPRGHDLEVWFSATSVYGCNEYDSNAGANYHYSIE